MNIAKDIPSGYAPNKRITTVRKPIISLSETPITVNAISPGWIQVKNYEELTELDHKQHPSRRVGKPKDILNACLFLASEDNDFINGHNLVVDGGMTKKMIYEE